MIDLHSLGLAWLGRGFSFLLSPEFVELRFHSIVLRIKLLNLA